MMLVGFGWIAHLWEQWSPSKLLSSVAALGVNYFASTAHCLRMLHAGIENDVKLWSPTAEEAHPPGKEAEEIMEKNKSEANLSGHPAMLSPQLIFQMLRMQQIPFPRTRRCVALHCFHPSIHLKFVVSVVWLLLHCW